MQREDQISDFRKFKHNMMLGGPKGQPPHQHTPVQQQPPPQQMSVQQQQKQVNITFLFAFGFEYKTRILFLNRLHRSQFQLRFWISHRRHMR